MDKQLAKGRLGWVLASATILAMAAMLVRPASVQAADIVTFSSDTEIILGNTIDLIIVSGSAADEVIIDQEGVSLTVDVDATDTLTLQSPSGYRLTNDGGLGECTEVAGVIEVTVTGADVVVFTPGNKCSGFGNDSSGSTGGGGGLTTTTPSVDLTSPNSGTLVVGDEVDVRWTSSSSLIDTVKLEYSTNGGATYSLIADDIDKSLGSYTWTVPNAVSSNVVIKITAQDSGKGYLDTDVSGTLVIESDSPASEDEEPTQEEEDEDAGITTDEEGRRWAPESNDTGSSPFDGSTEVISEVQEGWYVRGEHYDTVYYLPGDGTRRPFWDAQTFMTWADSWDEVIWVTDATLQTLTLEDPMLPQPGIVLIKISSDPRVYHVEVDAATSEFKLRHVTEEAIASTMFGSNWADYIIDVDPTIFTHYEAGTAITFAEEVDTSDMETRMRIASQVAGN